MNLLGARLYDPAGAVTKATSALLAMTAMDTTNLRLTFTVPAHGMVAVKLRGVVHGATTFPTVLLGVMNGSTVVGRVAAIQLLGNTAITTTMISVVAEFVVVGLTPGSVSWDAAYGVETIVAATGIKYGGPNDTTANNAFGGFSFEVYDPQPINPAGQLSVDANGRVDAIKIAGTTQTARDLGANVDVVLSTRATPANILTTALTETYAADGDAPTLSQLLFLVQQHLGESSISGSTKTVKKLDGSTTAATFTIGLDAGDPISVTRAT
jgi:hypothetical protein